MNKEFQYTYNEVNFREKMQLLSNKLTGVGADLGGYISLIIMFILSGCAFLYFDMDGSGIIVGPLFLIVGIAFFFRLLFFYYQRRAYQMAFKESIEVTIARLNETNCSVRISISDENFFYTDGDLKTELKWESIDSYLTIDRHLYVFHNGETLMCYVISAEDIGSSNFDEVLEFVQQKVELHRIGNFKSSEKKANPDILDS